ncbi:MAG: hypothetical protein R3B97_01295 [Dehalococcoidia bacterium]|nr:hypothetical protein [Dehalococcoidia bacterium]MCB9486208.1 hypothetical protein [Thermoflexaceae bacterium]
MSDELRAILVMLCAVNPAAVALAAKGRIDSRQIATVTGVAAIGLALVAATVSSGVLELLGTTEPSFQLAAGVVMMGMGLGALVWPGTNRAFAGGWREGIFPLAFPMVFNPAVAVGVVHYGASDGVFAGVSLAAVGVIAAVGFAWFAGERWPRAMEAIARMTGAGLVVLAVGLVVESVKSV